MHLKHLSFGQEEHGFAVVACIG